MKNPTDIKANLHRMMVSSCSCMTKTSDPNYHYVDCRYRQLQETLEYIELLEKTNKNLREQYESDKPR